MEARDDMNDRALRDITVGLGGPATASRVRTDSTSWSLPKSWHLLPRAQSGGFEATARQYRGRLRRDLSPIRAKDLNAQGAMTVLLKEALKPNLVQTLENNPAFIHEDRSRTSPTAAIPCWPRRRR